MSKDKNKRFIEGVSVLIFAVVFLAVMFPAIVRALQPDYEPGEVEKHILPSDICMIDGQPLMPELTYFEHGHGTPSRSGLGLQYINTDGDLVLLVKDLILGIYEGDFCNG